MKHILVVEDEPRIAQIVRDYLERAGFKVDVATTGEEALAATRSRRPDLIVLDLGLPKVDGREVLKRIWGDRRLRHIPVIVLTGSDEDEDMVRSYKSGAVAYLRKPVQVDQLVRAVGDLNGYRLLIARVAD